MLSYNREKKGRSFLGVKLFSCYDEYFFKTEWGKEQHIFKLKNTSVGG